MISTFEDRCAVLGRFTWSHKRLEACVVCEATPLPQGRFKYCSDKCSRWFTENHDWTSAQAAALRANKAVNFAIVVEHTHLEATYHFITKELLHPAQDYDREMKIACCSRCLRPEGHHTMRLDWRETMNRRLEVDHIIPLNGGKRSKTCMNHQSNLRVVCHECHLLLTKEQRAAGLIGRKK